MRHRKDGRKFGRDPKHRKALLRTLVSQLFVYEKIKTTDAKAKEVKRVAEKLITKAKSLGDILTKEYKQLTPEEKAKHLHIKRILASKLRRWLSYGENEKVDVVKKLMTEIAPRFKDRHGGYTRIVKLGIRRVGDCAPLSLIELVETKESTK